MDWRIFDLSFFSFLFTLIHASNSKLSTEKCIELGLSANLLCSSCDALKQFKLGALVENCRSCCHADGDDGSTAKKYAKAVLEVCNWKLGRFPQIQAFVRSEKPDNFPNLEIRFIRGADPILKLQDELGEMKEELSIEKWNTDSVEEFLNERLKK